MSTGKVIQIIGPVVDVEFPVGKLPAIYNAVHIKRGDCSSEERKEIVAEVEYHLGENTVRTIAMEPTEGLTRGLEVVDTGGPISVPVGREVLGRIINVIGEPVDKVGPVNAKERYPIHRGAPTFEEQWTSTEMLETGIKVIDLLELYRRWRIPGGQCFKPGDRLSLIIEFIRNIATEHG